MEGPKVRVKLSVEKLLVLLQDPDQMMGLAFDQNGGSDQNLDVF